MNQDKLIKNAVLPSRQGDNPDQLMDIHINNNGYTSAPPSNISSPPPTLILPSLCHPHIHLDKAYLLTSHPKPSNQDEYPDYSDLGLESGDFSEALSKTSQAKTRYTVPDLIFRGSQLITESVQAGVTSMRAFVEVDHVTQFKCLEAAVALKKRFSRMCYIQICAFAQDPIMSTEHGEENRTLMEEALTKFAGHVEVLGTTPYVEENQSYGTDNIKWAIDTAIHRGLHLDFHLDYNTVQDTDPLIWTAIQCLKETWARYAPTGIRVAFGHCSRMTLFTDDDFRQLADELKDLPVAFVGLPTSDLFMMGRPGQDNSQSSHRFRGTLQVIDMIQKYRIPACVGVNNVGNAFTPWGSADPLRLASLGVGIYQAGTADQAKILYECVSTRARHAIGLQRWNAKEGGDLDEPQTLHDAIEKPNAYGYLAIANDDSIKLLSEAIQARQRLTVTDVVWDPPELRLRQLYYQSEA